MADISPGSNSSDVRFSRTSEYSRIHGRILNYFRGITLEPIVFFSALALGALTVTVQNYYMKVVCYKIYDPDISAGKINDTCHNLSLTDEQEKVVQGQVSYYLVFRDTIETGIPALFAILWFGDWCDKFGCKPLLLLALIGNMLSSLLFYIFYMVIFTSQTPFVLLSASIPIAISGGGIAMSVAGFTYMAKVVDEENRGARLAVLEGITLFGGSLGLFAGNVIFKHGGYAILFGAACGVQAFALIYAFLFVRNDKLENVESPSRNNWSDIFGISSVIGTVKTFTRRREGKTRLWLILLALFYGLRMFTYAGPSNLFLLYSRLVFKWNQDDYTSYAIADASLLFLGLLFASLLFLKLLKLKEIPVMVIGTISYAAACAVWGIGSWSGNMYLGSLIASTYGICNPLSRSLAAQIIPLDEIGKINSFLSLEDAIVPLVAGPLYVLLYNSTKDFYPGATFFINGGITLLSLSVLSIFWVSFRPSNRYSTLEVNSGETPETE